MGHSRFGSWTGYKGWAAIGGRLRQVSIGKGGVQWGVASNDTIWTRTTGGWRHVNGKAKNHHKKMRKNKKTSAKAKKIMKKKVSKRIIKRMKKKAPKRVSKWLIRWRLRWARLHRGKHYKGHHVRRHYKKNTHVPKKLR